MLAYYASDIQARHEAGRVQFAIDLGRELEQALRKPERYQRSTSDCCSASGCPCGSGNARPMVRRRTIASPSCPPHGAGTRGVPRVSDGVEERSNKTPDCQPAARAGTRLEDTRLKT
ncbi:hypothetical protein [Verrucomicrobium spinosum]|uniref:hypothetical protein n=1 Tax=Verrucomicrobium spinosum TaxID=2736 RepID=UPI0009463E79|nr:hypothetical protein [Verrucomicrobium spinosum]